MNSIVIVGATSAIAQACARQWVGKGFRHFELIGRNSDSLNILANDLTSRSSGVIVHTHVGDLLSPQDASRLTADVLKSGTPEVVLIAQGSLPQQGAAQADPFQLHASIEINAISPSLFAEAFAAPMSESTGTIALIGSVAGDRGRQSNYVYGASKAFLDTFARGMQHRFHGSQLNILLIKPGPVDTPMTSGMEIKPSGMASVNKVASDILHAIEKRKSVIYSPSKWRLIMAVIRAVPSFIFNKTSL